MSTHRCLSDQATAKTCCATSREITPPESMLQEEVTDLIADAGFFRQVLDNLADGVYIVDRERRILYWNKSSERITGYDAREALGRYCQDNLLMHTTVDGEMLCHSGCPLLATMTDGQLREADVFLRHKDGARVPVRVRVAPLFSGDRRIVGAVETFSDNSSKVQALQMAQEYEAMAFLDPLTGLGNRRFADAKLEQMHEKFRSAGWDYGLIFLDLDHFKNVNDEYGHDAGDAVLRMVAGALNNAIRNFDFVARWGGEEFVVIVQAQSLGQVVAIAERCRMLVASTPLFWNQQPIHITASFGATIIRSEDDLDTIVNRADLLLYDSKAAGRNCVTAD